MGSKTSKKAQRNVGGKRISQTQIIEIRFLQRQGRSYKSISKELGVSLQTVGLWVRRSADDLVQHRAGGHAPTYNML